MLRNNEEGIALIMVLIMLAVVGVLAAVLLRTARTHTNIAVHEEGMSKAFHSAEAGVEYVRANFEEAMDKMENNEEIIYPEDNNDEYMIFGKNKFNIEGDQNNNRFISKGIYESVDGSEYSEKISLYIKIKGAGGNFNIPDEDYKGGGTVNLEDYVNIAGYYDGDFVEYYNEYIKFDEVRGFNDPNFVDLNDFDNYINFESSGDIDEFDSNNNKFDVTGNVEGINLEFANNYSKMIEISSDKGSVTRSISDTNINVKEENGLSINDVDIDGNNETIIYVDGDLDLRSTKIKDAAVIVNGSLNIDSQVDIQDSYFIVRDYVDGGGMAAEPEWTSPLFYIYGENPLDQGNERYYLRLGGLGQVVEIDTEKLPQSLKRVPGEWQQQIN